MTRTRIATGAELQLVDWINLKEAMRPREQWQVWEWNNATQRHDEDRPRKRVICEQIKKLAVSAPHGSGLWCYQCAGRLGEVWKSNVDRTGALRGKPLPEAAAIHVREHIFATWSASFLLVWRDAWIEGQANPRVLTEFLQGAGLTVRDRPIPDEWVPGFAPAPLVLA